MLLLFLCLTVHTHAELSECRGPTNSDGAALDDGTTGACNPWMAQRLCNPDHNPGDSSSDGSTDGDLVRFGFILPLSTNDAMWETPSTFAMLCAIEAVNADPLILPDIVLEPVFADSKSSQNGGVEAGLCLMQDAHVPFFLGPQYSSSAFGAATVGKIFDIALLGTTTSSPELSNQDPNNGFPTFSRIFPSDAYQGHALAQLVAHYNWEEIVLISLDDDPYCTGIAAAFTASAYELDFKVRKKLTLPADFAEQYVWDTTGKKKLSVVLQDIEDLAVTVVLVIGYKKDANRVLAAAQERGMLGKGWAWLGTEAWIDSTPDFLGEGGDPLSTEGVMGTSVNFSTSSDAFVDLQTCFSAHRDDSDGPFGTLSWITSTPQLYAVFVYDAALFMAHAFHELSQSVANDTTAAQLNAVLASDLDAVLAALRNNTAITFDGITGPLQLATMGDRIGASYNIQNMVAGADGSVSIKSIGAYSETQGLTIAQAAVFPGGSTVIPSGFGLQDDEEDIWKYLAFTVLILSFAGLVVMAVWLWERNYEDTYQKPTAELTTLTEGL